MKDVCQIRVATPKDAARIAVLGANVWVHTYATEGVSDLIAQYVLTTFTPKKVLAGLNDPTVVLLVAEKEGNLAGYAVMRFGSYHAEIPTEIETLYIQDTFAGHGIGSALLHRARNIAMDRAGSQSIVSGLLTTPLRG